MELAFVAALLIVTIIAVIALVIGVPFLFAMLAYDLVESKKAAAATAVEATPKAPATIALKRGVARVFVVAGAAFWSVATYAELHSLQLGSASVGNAMLAAFIPLGASLATLVVGWYWERLTAALLVAGAVAAVAWGVIYQFTPLIWMIVTFSLIGPMLTAAILFWQARRDQEAYERATSFSPQLAFVVSARSGLRP